MCARLSKWKNDAKRRSNPSCCLADQRLAETSAVVTVSKGISYFEGNGVHIGDDVEASVSQRRETSSVTVALPSWQLLHIVVLFVLIHASNSA